ncbi:hypothetical protein L211DRAFT_403472 [Terfezia boudieri ATCC MYA-4762]|uniref:Uncharacterized protein n=1 Tax=Terfezia boudieri ATCC MYA-4762 TaxID=1051890 RepID=A0A3N4M454_9PEZI|nr:hypothetical protein L211DRAFT_403472 [Terfezia boudieri ATCC MYA-4762]
MCIYCIYIYVKWISSIQITAVLSSSIQSYLQLRLFYASIYITSPTYDTYCCTLLFTYICTVPTYCCTYNIYYLLYRPIIVCVSISYILYLMYSIYLPG